MTNITFTLETEKSPTQVYAAINDVRAWWGSDPEASTAALGDVWDYRYKHLHYSKQRTSELVSDSKVVWDVLEANLSFAAKPDEWKGTKVAFDIRPKGKKTEVVFTHLGLAPSCDCYEACVGGWDYYINTSLKSLIETGTGKPDPKW